MQLFISEKLYGTASLVVILAGLRIQQVKLSYKNPFLTHTFHDFHLIFKNDTVPKTDSLLNKIATFWMETKISHIFGLLHLTLSLDPDPD